MPTIAERQIQSVTRDVVVAGVHYRIRAISSTDILQVGGGFLLSLQARSATAAPAAGVGGHESEDEKKARLAAEREHRFEVLRRDPSLLANGHKFQEAVVCASVFEASLDGLEWMPHRFVLDPRQEHGPSGRAHISVLRTHVGELAKAVMALTNGEGHGGDGQETFPPRAARAAKDPARARRKGVRN